MRYTAVCVWLMVAVVSSVAGPPVLESGSAPEGPWTAMPETLLMERGAGAAWGIGAAADAAVRFYRVVDPEPGTGYCVSGIRASSAVRFVPEALDSDADTVPDCADVCPGQDDRVDGDLDGLPDACDPDPLVPAGMALIPAGPFEMGDPHGMGGPQERPVHIVEVRGFFLDQHEVGWRLWDEVRTWALEHGYELGPGARKGADHPVHLVNWYDAVKWCNARSEWAGLTPVYRTTAGEVYRAGQVELRNEDVLWDANGYRLATEAEWEKAARGGLAGQQFPWGNRIERARANYAESGDAYETGALPWTTPLGFYPSNGYALYDMAGNVFEWCWDWWDPGWYTTAEATQADPRGPAGPGGYRAVRGGSWFWSPFAMRCAYRGWDEPRFAGNGLGLRCARAQTPPAGPRADWPVPGPGADQPLGGQPEVQYAATAGGPWQIDPYAILSQTAEGVWAGFAGDGGARFFRLLGPGQAQLPCCAFVDGPAVTLEAVSAAHDTDGDTVPDCDDRCPGEDDRVDENLNGEPDMCETFLERSVFLPGGVRLALIPVPGRQSYFMGSPTSERSRWADESPLHGVTIWNDFYMGKYEVTQAQWLALMGSWPESEPTSRRGLGDTCPAYFISWDDAKAFISSLNAHILATGQGPLTVRLPTEAEWEYACRAGTRSRFYFGDSLGVGDICEDDGQRGLTMWYCGNRGLYGAKPVGTRLPNAFGLYDMHGNISEWCEDTYQDGYVRAPTDGRAWVVAGAAVRVVRGGNWNDSARSCRSAARTCGSPSFRFSLIGFRLAATQQ